MRVVSSPRACAPQPAPLTPAVRSTFAGFRQALASTTWSSVEEAFLHVPRVVVRANSPHQRGPKKESALPITPDATTQLDVHILESNP